MFHEMGGPVTKPSFDTVFVMIASPAHHSQNSHFFRLVYRESIGGTGVPIGSPLYFLLYVLLLLSICCIVFVLLRSCFTSA